MPARRWIAAYSNFVRNISATYDPPPEIFLTISHCTTGNASRKYCADTRAAYESMKAEGIKNVHFLDITQNGTGAWWSLGAAGGGCDSHPSFLAHALMGKIAAPKVKEAMRWKTDDTLGSQQLTARQSYGHQVGFMLSLCLCSP